MIENSEQEIQEVIAALTEKKFPDRNTVLYKAYEKGLFADVRLYPYVASTLESKNNDLVTGAEQRWLPQCGAGIVPFLVADFKYEDKKPNILRLRFMGQFGYGGMGEVIQRVFAEKLPKLQAEAEGILACRGDKATEQSIISLADSKNKDIRAAAYAALATIGSPNCIERLYQAYAKDKKGGVELLEIVLAIGKLPLADDYERFLTITVRDFNALIALPKTTKEETILDAYERFHLGLTSLTHKDYDAVHTFLERVLFTPALWSLLRSIYIDNEVVIDKVVAVLDSFAPERAVVFYEKHIANIPRTRHYDQSTWMGYFRQALRVYDKAQIFEVFSPQYGKTIYDLFAPFTDRYNVYFYKEGDLEGYKERIDLRWKPIILQDIEQYIADDKLDAAYRFRELLEHLLLLRLIETDKEAFNKLIDRILPTLKEVCYTEQLKIAFNI